MSDPPKLAQNVKTDVLYAHPFKRCAFTDAPHSFCGIAAFRWVYFNCARQVSTHMRPPVPPELHDKYRAEADHKLRSIIDFSPTTIGMFSQSVDTGFLGFHKFAMGLRRPKRQPVPQTSSKMPMWTIFLMQSNARYFIALPARSPLTNSSRFGRQEQSGNFPGIQDLRFLPA